MIENYNVKLVRSGYYRSGYRLYIPIKISWNLDKLKDYICGYYSYWRLPEETKADRSYFLICGANDTVCPKNNLRYSSSFNFAEFDYYKFIGGDLSSDTNENSILLNWNKNLKRLIEDEEIMNVWFSNSGNSITTINYMSVVVPRIESKKDTIYLENHKEVYDAFDSLYQDTLTDEQLREVLIALYGGYNTSRDIGLFSFSALDNYSGDRHFKITGPKVKFKGYCTRSIDNVPLDITGDLRTELGHRFFDYTTSDSRINSRINIKESKLVKRDSFSIQQREVCYGALSRFLDISEQRIDRRAMYSEYD
jgi:hypothetical protein